MTNHFDHNSKFWFESLNEGNKKWPPMGERKPIIYIHTLNFSFIKNRKIPLNQTKGPFMHDPIPKKKLTSAMEVGIDLKLLRQLCSRMKYLLREHSRPNRLKRMRWSHPSLLPSLSGFSIVEKKIPLFLIFPKEKKRVL